MQVLDQFRTLEALCKATGKWGMYISWNSDTHSFGEMLKAAPYLNYLDHSQVLMEGSAILLFDSQEEMIHHYDLTVGDDGPTKLNPYNGLARVYALTCDPTGQLRNENT